MEEDKSRKTEELLDEEGKSEETPQQPAEEKKTKRKQTPEEQMAELRKLCSGKMELMVPLRAHGQDVKEISFDFTMLSGLEMVNALDEAGVNNIFAISNAQAMALFAAAVAKRAPTIEENGMVTKLYDANDIKNRLSAPDFSYALRLAKLFYNASSQAGSRNTLREQ